MIDRDQRIAERERILGSLRKILIENLDVRREPDEIDPDTPIFGSGLGLDSVDAVELLIGLEVELDVKMPDDAMGRAYLRTVNTVIDFVLEYRSHVTR